MFKGRREEAPALMADAHKYRTVYHEDDPPAGAWSGSVAVRSIGGGCTCGWKGRQHPDTADGGVQAFNDWWNDHYTPLVRPDPGELLILSNSGGSRCHYLAGRPVASGTKLELRLTGRRWVPVRYEWSERADAAPRFYLELGGPWESFEEDGPETYIMLSLERTVFRWPDVNALEPITPGDSMFGARNSYDTFGGALSLPRPQLEGSSSISGRNGHSGYDALADSLEHYGSSNGNGHDPLADSLERYTSGRNGNGHHPLADSLESYSPSYNGHNGNGHSNGNGHNPLADSLDYSPNYNGNGHDPLADSLEGYSPGRNGNGHNPLADSLESYSPSYNGHSSNGHHPPDPLADSLETPVSERTRRVRPTAPEAGDRPTFPGPVGSIEPPRRARQDAVPEPFGGPPPRAIDPPMDTRQMDARPMDARPADAPPNHARPPMPPEPFGRPEFGGPPEQQPYPGQPPQPFGQPPQPFGGPPEPFGRPEFGGPPEPYPGQPLGQMVAGQGMQQELPPRPPPTANDSMATQFGGIPMGNATFAGGPLPQRPMDARPMDASQQQPPMGGPGDNGFGQQPHRTRIGRPPPGFGEAPGGFPQGGPEQPGFPPPGPPQQQPGFPPPGGPHQQPPGFPQGGPQQPPPGFPPGGPPQQPPGFPPPGGPQQSPQGFPPQQQPPPGGPQQPGFPPPGPPQQQPGGQPFGGGGMGNGADGGSVQDQVSRIMREATNEARRAVGGHAYPGPPPQYHQNGHGRQQDAPPPEDPWGRPPY